MKLTKQEIIEIEEELNMFFSNLFEHKGVLEYTFGHNAYNTEIAIQYRNFKDLEIIFLGPVNPTFAKELGEMMEKIIEERTNDEKKK